MASETLAPVEKKDYYKIVSYYKKNFKHITQKDWMSKRWVDIMIQRIENAQEVIAKHKSRDPLHATVKETLKKYDVVILYQKEMLVLKPDPDDESETKIIIPLEETFEVVEEAHLRTNHGTQKEMEKWIRSNNYIMHGMCTHAYLKLCNKCRGKTLSNNQTKLSLHTPDILKLLNPKVYLYDHVIKLHVLDLSTRPDNYYNYLLIYEDERTGLIQLRPMNNNVEADICVELIKILMDFGTPQCMAVDPENMQLCNKILCRVTALCGRKIALASFEHADGEKLTRKITQNIMTWMEKADCQNWGTGCYVVQWQLNNVPDEQGITPFSRVFACDQSIMMTNPIIQNADEDNEMIVEQNMSSQDSMNENPNPAIQNKEQCSEMDESHLLGENIKNDNSNFELRTQGELTSKPVIKYEPEDED